MALTLSQTKLKIPMAVRLLAALVLGTIVGIVLGPRAEGLGEVGLLVIKFLKTLATPLIFFAIIDGFLKTEIKWRQGAKLLCISSTNAVVAAVIAISLAHLLPAHRLVNLAPLKAAMAVSTSASSEAITPHPARLSFLGSLKSFVPQNITEPFATNNVIAVVMLAVLFGIALRKLKVHSPREVDVLEQLVHGTYRVLTTVLEWIVALVPIAVFAVIAKVVGSTGFAVFQILGVFVCIVTLGLAVHVVIYYSLLLVIFVKISPLKFFKNASDALITAFTTGSSLATLPVTLKTLQGPLGVSHESSRLAACVGSNLNHDGILLYEAATALFVAQVFGIQLSLDQQILLAITSALAAVGIAGVPEAGLITLSLVLGAVGLPLTAVPVLLPVDWFLGRLRATTNVASDMVVATLLDATHTDNNSKTLEQKTGAVDQSA